MNSFSYAGYKVVEVVLLAETKLQKRTWKERLFTRPWEPFATTKLVYEGPGKPIISEAQKIMYMSPQLATELKREIVTRGGIINES